MILIEIQSVFVEHSSGMNHLIMGYAPGGALLCSALKL